MNDGLDAAIDRLAQFNDDPEAGGITREVFTPTYAEALEWVAERMRGAGLETRLDAFGNLWGRWAGSEPDAPRVITGSHVDTTLNAGSYDGVVGVLGAIEAVRSLRDAGFAPRRSLEVIAVAGEEPRFGTGCIGSRALVGALGPRDPTDARPRRRLARRGAARRRLRPRPDRRGRGWTPRPCTRSWSCTSSRPRCSRRAASRSAS